MGRGHYLNVFFQLHGERRHYHSACLSGGCVEEAWFGWPCDKKLEDLRDQFSREGDPAKQVEIGIALQKRAYEVVPYVNYGQWFQPTAYRTSLKGVLISPVPFFWNIEK